MVSPLNDRFVGDLGNYILFRDMSDVAGLFIVSTRPELSPWNGEGPPPVGLKVEAYFSNDTNPCWLPFTLHYISDVTVVFDGGRGETCRERQFINSLKFRPIRTPEQIAADEREAAAIDLYMTINWNDTRESWDFLSGGRREDYRKAIKAGYRKLVTKES